VLVEEVWDELTTLRSSNPAVQQRAKAVVARASDFEFRSLAIGTPAAATYAALRAGTKSRRDRGEDASIALAAHDSALEFVTGDVAATFSALAELPGRVVAFHPFLRRLHEQHDIAKATLAIAGAVPSIAAPTWWAPWLAS